MESYIRKNTNTWNKVGRHLPSVSSTSDVLAADIAAARRRGEVLPEGYSVSADFQTSGRGRKGRVWDGAPGQNVTVSYLLSDAGLSPARLFTLSQNIALAVRDTVASFAPTRNCQVKWPNDVLADGRKLAGILIETNLVADRVAYVIAGIGVNVNQEQFAPDLSATSISAVSGTPVDVGEVYARLTENLRVSHDRLTEWAKLGDLYEVQRRYHAHLHGLGESLTWRHLARDSCFAARLKGVMPDGRIRLEAEGEEHNYSLDEVRLERGITYVG